MAKIQPLAGLARVPLKDALPLDTPFSAYIYPTNFCNLKCTYCAHSLGREGMEREYGFAPETMEMETYYKAINQLAAFDRPLKTLSLTGQGEPLLHPGLCEMIAYAKERRVTERVEFMSNGVLLRRETAQALVDAGLDCIRISLQGMSNEKYKAVCGLELDFEQFTEQIAWLYANKKQCEVFVKIMDIALEEGGEEAFYKRFGPIADRVSVEHCRPVYSGVTSTKGLTAETDRYGRAHAPRRVCPLCFYMLGVFPNGDVYPCETIYRPALLGNVHTHSLREIWEGSQLRAFRAAQLRGEKDKNPNCAKCCASDDVAHPEDELDASAALLLERFAL